MPGGEDATTTATRATTEAAAHERKLSRFVRGALQISGLTLVSRILGLCRDLLQFHVLGTGWQNAMFVNAWMVPNLFRRLFGEGALSAAFVPVFTSTIDAEGVATGRRLLAAVSGALCWLLLGLCGLVLVAALGLDPATLRMPDRGDVGGIEQARLLLELVALLFPYLLPICLVALGTGALNAVGRFALPSLAPALLNVAWIAALWVVWRGAPRDPADVVRLLAVALLAGGALQLLLVAYGLRRAGLLVWPDLRMRHPGLRTVLRSMAPMVLGLSLVQINVVIDQEVAVYLVEREGANTLIYLANRLLLFPQALIGTALGTAVFPLLALLGGRRDERSMGEVLDQALAVSSFLAVPATAGLLILAPEIIEVMYRHGRFGAEDAQEAAWVLRALICGLPFMTINQILVRAYYARGDTGTPVRVSIWLMVANLCLNLLLARPLGAAGLALATSVCAVANSLLLLGPLRVGGAGSALRTATLRTLLSTAGMVVIILAIKGSLSELAAGSRLRMGLIMVAAPILLGAAAYFACNHLLGGEELARLLLHRRRPSGR